MKKPAVNYCGLRLSNINAPQFSHLKLLLIWPCNLILYMLTERLIPTERCLVVHCWLDDLVPFCEWFVIPYVSWYFLILGSVVYFLLYNVETFRKMQIYLFLTQIIAMTVYIVFPSRQELRPDVFPRANGLSHILGFLYRLDTNTGVCPSLHVAYSLGIGSTWLREKSVSRWIRGVIALWCGLICISVAFVKQHSVADILAAVPICLFAEWFAFLRKKEINSQYLFSLDEMDGID